jgi:hypothetical protein
MLQGNGSCAHVSMYLCAHVECVSVFVYVCTANVHDSGK